MNINYIQSTVVSVFLKTSHIYILGPHINVFLSRIFDVTCFAIQDHLIHLTFMSVFKRTIGFDHFDTNIEFQDDRLNPPFRCDQNNHVVYDQIDPKPRPV